MTLISPATSADLAECAGTTTWAQWGQLMAQRVGGVSWALRDAAGTAIACGGIVPFKPSIGEAWFTVNVDGLASRHLHRLVRAIALTLPTAPYPIIFAVTETAEGARLAELLGFASFERGIYLWARLLNHYSAAEEMGAQVPLPSNRP